MSPNQSQHCKIIFVTRILYFVYERQRALYQFSALLSQLLLENHIWIVLISLFDRNFFFVCSFMFPIFVCNRNDSTIRRRRKYYNWMRARARQIEINAKKLWIILEMLSFRFSEIRFFFCVCLCRSEWPIFYLIFGGSRGAAPTDAKHIFLTISLENCRSKHPTYDRTEIVHPNSNNTLLSDVTFSAAVEVHRPCPTEIWNNKCTKVW